MSEEFTPQTVKKGIDEIIAAITQNTEFEARTAGRASYEDDRFTVKLEIKLVGTEPREQKDLKWAFEHDLTPWQYGDLIEVDRKHCKVVGWRPRATKRPLLVETVGDGKQYTLPRRRTVHNRTDNGFETTTAEWERVNG